MVRDPQTFTAFGATGRSENTAGITLEEAIARALNDFKADPGGVFLLRAGDLAGHLGRRDLRSGQVETATADDLAPRCEFEPAHRPPPPARGRTLLISLVFLVPPGRKADYTSCPFSDTDRIYVAVEYCELHGMRGTLHVRS